MEIIESKMTTQRKYDEICGVGYVNMYTLTKNSDTIVIAPFNPKNQEHMFVLSIARCIGGIFGKKIYVATNPLKIAQLNRKVEKENRVARKTRKMTPNINPDKFLDDFRMYAQKKCGMNFSFSNIYNEFYKTKGNK